MLFDLMLFDLSPGSLTFDPWPSSSAISSYHLHLPGAGPAQEPQKQAEGARAAWNRGPWASSGATGPGIEGKTIRPHGGIREKPRGDGGPTEKQL